MKEIAIVFPNQLHRNNKILQKKIPIYLIEEFLFFPAIFGYISCIVIFKVGVALRSIFMRDEDYYD